MAAPSTKQRLLSLVDDVEIVSKELLELLSTPKAQRPEGIDIKQLVELMKLKDDEIKDTLKIAAEQAELQKKMDALRSEVERRDADIRQLQKNLKEAESVLATAIYQAKQKLNAINQANRKRISSEDLIKYAHRISASNAVAAPPTWVPGDNRRPYPTDMEMRMGFLGRLSDLPLGNPGLLSASLFGQDAMAPGRHPNMEQLLSSQPTTTTSTASSTTWHSSVSTSGLDHSTSTTHGLSAPVPPHSSHGKDDDVELMSSDSSSSSSSDE